MPMLQLVSLLSSLNGGMRMSEVCLTRGEGQYIQNEELNFCTTRQRLVRYILFFVLTYRMVLNQGLLSFSPLACKLWYVRMYVRLIIICLAIVIGHFELNVHAFAK